MMRRILLLGGVLAAVTVYGALPPQYAAERRKRIYARARQQQAAAGVAVYEVTVLSVVPGRWQTDPEAAHRRFRICRAVASVDRTIRGASPKGRIRFAWRVLDYAPGAVGPVLYNPLFLQAGDRVRVWLRAGKSGRVAAAGPLSFERLP